MTIRAVVLDMDGLMLDTEPIYKASWQQACAELGFDLDDAAHASMLGRPNADCERELVRLFGPGFPLERFQVRWQDLWRTFADGRGIPTKPGLPAFLAFAEEHALLRAIATSSERDFTEFSLGSAGIGDRFDAVVTGDQVSQGKPAPDIYLEAARQLRVDPAHCVALEDSSAGTLAAAAAGMQAICIPDLAAPSEEAARAATCVLDSLDEAREWIAARVPRR